MTYCKQDSDFRSKDTNMLKVEGWKKISMQIVIKRELVGCTTIRQNTL